MLALQRDRRHADPARTVRDAAIAYDLAPGEAHALARRLVGPCPERRSDVGDVTADELQAAVQVADDCGESARLLVASLCLCADVTINRSYRLGAIQHLLKTRPTTSRRKRPA